ncbi:MAG: HAMP domain-containing protein, partial [Solirubrobacteraceae bacterium]|nr:HAMP domain-containing protein [Solirubrobacteraceae bacterium]
MNYLLVASAVGGGLLLLLLAAASGNRTVLTEHYPLLLWLNVAIAVALVALVGTQLYRLLQQLRQQVFGARLTLRMLAFFALMALVPGALVYMVSVQFLTRSIESWFDVRVDKALEGGINLGRTALDSMLAELVAKTRVIAGEIGDVPPSAVPVVLDRLRERVGASEALLLTANGSVIASASRDLAKLVADPPPSPVLRQARQNRGYAAVESSGDASFLLRVIEPLPNYSLTEEPRLLQLTQPVPQSLATSAENVQSVYRDYRELALARQGLKQIYLLSLTLTLLFALFTAFALAFVLSRKLSAPLADLAEGTLAVARGDFSRRAKVASRDELGILTRSFNAMTAQLDDARQAAEASRGQVEDAKARIENILANLSAGVLVFDAELRLEAVNSGAGAILKKDLAPCVGQQVAAVAALGPLAPAIAEGVAAGAGDWQRELELPETGQVILARGSTLSEASGGAHIVVFDDVTQV